MRSFVLVNACNHFWPAIGLAIFRSGGRILESCLHVHAQRPKEVEQPLQRKAIESISHQGGDLMLAIDTTSTIRVVVWDFGNWYTLATVCTPRPPTRQQDRSRWRGLT